MNNSYTDGNGGTNEVSGTTKSRLHISTDVRNALALFVAAVTLLAAVWGVCESSISRLEDRFDQQDAELAWIKSTTVEGFRLANDRIDRLEAKVDRIETLLLDYLLRIDVPDDESTSDPAAKPAGRGEGASQPLPAKPVVPRKGVPH